MPQALQAKAAREMDRRNTLSTSAHSSSSPLPIDHPTEKAFARWRKAKQTKIDLKAVKYVSSLAFLRPRSHPQCSRARYLELLSSAPRQPPQPQRISALAPRAPRNVFPASRKPRPATPEEQPPPPPPEPPRPASSVSRTAYTRPSAANPPRLGIASLLTTKTRSASPERQPRSPERPKFSSRRTAPREPSPPETGTETDGDPGPGPAPSSYRGGIEAWRKEVRPVPPKSAPPSVAGDVPARSGGRSSLWQELKEVRRRSRAPTERMYSPEPL